MLRGGVLSNGEVRLSQESIEAVARLVAELMAPEDNSVSDRPPQAMSAAEVADRWGVGRRWVYDHADFLGASRLGSGGRPRLRFDPEKVAEILGGQSDRRGDAPPRGGSRFDSLSARHRATVVRQTKYGRGGARTPPGLAPNKAARR